MTPPAWNLTDLFASSTDPRIDQLLDQATQETQQLVVDFKGKIAEKSPADINALLQRYEAILQNVAKPQTFARLRHAADSRVPEHGAFLEKMKQRGLAIVQELLFVDLEIAKLPTQQLEQLVQAPETAHYRHFLENIRMSQPHKLSEVEERLWNDLSLTGSHAFVRLFDEEDGRGTYLFRGKNKTRTELLQLIHNSDRAIRKEAAETLSAGFTAALPRTSYIYNTLIADHELTCRYRHFDHPEQLRHLDNETTAPAVEALAQAVEQAYPTFQNYYAWKRDLLGLDQLFDYDRYAPLATNEVSYTFEEAKTIILNAFGAFSPTFRETAEQFFAKGWIDAELRPGKRGGAFCSYVTADTHPYVLVNFGGRIGDVLTLAHELGHAIHAMLARPNGYLQFSTPLTMAETASVFAEMIVFDALKTQITDPKAKLGLYLHKIESVFATVFRQIGMHRFEQDVHTARREQGEQSAEAINALWAKRQQQLFGDAIVMTDGYRSWWSYVSHFFHVPFYVYAYAFGELLTLSLYAQYKNVGASFADKYTNLLKRGGSFSPAQSLAPLKIDLSSTEPWTEGLRLIDELVNEARALTV